MTLPELSIRRHVLAWMLNGLLVLFGLIAFQRIGIDRYPTVEFPTISVTTTLPGANPEVMDASVTRVIETAVNSVPGIEHVRSSSSPGASVVRIQFELTKNIDVAFNEVQAKVNQVLRDLPREADPPVVAKVEFGAVPILWLVLHGDRTLQQLNQYARTVVKRRLENVAGVGEVRIGGRRDRTIRVALDVARMNAYGITAGDLLRAFESEHLQLPGGFITSRTGERLLKLDLEFHHVRDLEALIVAYREGAPIRLRDIARIEDGLDEPRRLARYGERPAVGLGIVKVTGANMVAVVERVKRRLREEILPQLPPGLELDIAADDASLVHELVAALKEHLALGTVLTALVVLLFLRSLRATAIVALAVPVSLLSAVAVMYFAGYTFNTMTLLGLLLLIGVVVDDAIVVLENIVRHREHIDPDARRAALAGTRQVVFAVIAASLTLVSIFAPVIFMGGVIGRFFQSFAVVVTFGVLASLFVSLTLTPMLASRHLELVKTHGWLYRGVGWLFGGLERGYVRLLSWALRWRWAVVVLAVAAVLPSGHFLAELGKGFLPKEDEGRFLVNFKTPLGSSLAYTDGRLREIERVLASEPGVASWFSVIGGGPTGQVSRGEISVRLAPREQRSRHMYRIIDRLRERLARIPGVEAFPAPVPPIGGQRGEPLQFVLTGPDIQGVARVAERLRQRLETVAGLGAVDLNLQLALPQARLRIDRTRAADLGISTREVALAASLLVGGVDVAKYNDEPGDGERYDIRLQAAQGSFRVPEDLKRIYLRGRNGALVRLDSVARLDDTLGPAAITRLDLRYSAEFYSTPTVSLGEAVARVRKAAAGLLPPGYTVRMIGRAEEFGKTTRYMLFALATAVILVYMVLASQFDAFVQPLVIMVAQPLAIVGGLAALWLAGMGLNIFSMIGLVLLMGLVAKNSILLVDFANQLRHEGHGVNEALRAACPVRLRPVLMTSLTVIFTMLPAALGLGAGADTNGPLAVAVIGGMVSSTLLTLVVVPAVYSLVENGLLRMRARRRAGVAGA